MDYNWLLTTIVQSSATLIGIFSAFIILRISLMHYEKISYDILALNYSTSLAILNISKPDMSINHYKKENHNSVRQIITSSFKTLKDIETFASHYIKKNKKIPNNLYIGFVGIVWLIIFSLICPLFLINKEYLNEYIKYIIIFDFGFGVFLLLIYLISEIIVINKRLREKTKVNNSK